MPYAHHSDPTAKWKQQYLSTRHHIYPFISKHHPLPEHGNVLEIGCGEGGVLKAFSEAGHRCYGVDLSSYRIQHAERLLQNEVRSERITFYTGNIYDTAILQHLFGKIDLIVLKDAIEHIPDQEKILGILHQFLRKGGAVFLAFPPWLNPFGGHQQLASSILKYVPWFHILPRAIYRGILKQFGESETQIQTLLEIYDTRLSVNKFEALLKKTNWKIEKRQFFLFNPIYEYKFRIKGRKQLGMISAIPVLRDFLSTTVYYLIVE